MKKILSTLIMAAIAISSYGAEKSAPLTFTTGNTTIKFGGFINLAVGKYWDGATTSGKDFMTSQTAMDPSVDELRRLQFDPTSSRLSVKITQSTQALGDVNLNVEGDFRGAGNTLVLRIATIDFMGLTVGQTWSNMTDLASVAPTVDIQGVNSRTFFRTPQITYRHTVGEGVVVGAALESPIYRIKEQTPAEISSPDIVAFAQYKGDLGHIKAAGVWRTIPYITGQEVEHNNGWGVQLSGSIKAAERLTLYSQGIYGENIAKYINDLSGLTYDMLPISGSTGRLTTPMYGASVGAKVQLCEKVQFATSVSKAYADIESCYAGAIGETYKSGSYLSADLFYYPLSNFMMGIGYLNGSRTNYDGALGRAQRTNLLFRYTF